MTVDGGRGVIGRELGRSDFLSADKEESDLRVHLEDRFFAAGVVRAVEVDRAVNQSGVDGEHVRCPIGIRDADRRFMRPADDFIGFFFGKSPVHAADGAVDAGRAILFFRHGVFFACK